MTLNPIKIEKAQKEGLITFWSKLKHGDSVLYNFNR